MRTPHHRPGLGVGGTQGKRLRAAILRWNRRVVVRATSPPRATAIYIAPVRRMHPGNEPDSHRPGRHRLPTPTAVCRNTTLFDPIPRRMADPCLLMGRRGCGLPRCPCRNRYTTPLILFRPRRPSMTDLRVPSVPVNCVADPTRDSSLGIARLNPCLR